MLKTSLSMSSTREINGSPRGMGLPEEGSQWPLPSATWLLSCLASWELAGAEPLKEASEAGSCLAVGHGQCDWAAELVTKVTGGQRIWTCGLGLWEVKRKGLESSFLPRPV